MLMSPMHLQVLIAANFIIWHRDWLENLHCSPLQENDTVSKELIATWKQVVVLWVGIKSERILDGAWETMLNGWSDDNSDDNLEGY